MTRRSSSFAPPLSASLIRWPDDPTEIVTHQEKLNAATDDDVRASTDPHSGHVQSARSLAAAALDNSQARLFEAGETVTKPTFRGTVVVDDTRTITYTDDHCTLASVDRRGRGEYITPKDDGGHRLQSIGTVTSENGLIQPCTSATASTPATPPSNESLTRMRHQSRTERFSTVTSV